jgi:subtilase family serine protease
MLNIQLTPTRTLQTRVTEASADGGGVYTIAELAVVDTVSDQEYVTSVGGSYRRDDMSKEVKTIREGINAARRVAIKELNEATEKTVINAQATPVKETVTI